MLTAAHVFGLWFDGFNKIFLWFFHFYYLVEMTFIYGTKKYKNRRSVRINTKTTIRKMSLAVS
jgi:hypothetical protein